MITIIPVLIGGVIGRYVLKIDYSTLTGVLSGSCTNPPALAYAGEQDKDKESHLQKYLKVGFQLCNYRTYLFRAAFTASLNPFTGRIWNE